MKTVKILSREYFSLYGILDRQWYPNKNKSPSTQLHGLKKPSSDRIQFALILIVSACMKMVSNQCNRKYIVA